MGVGHSFKPLLHQPPGACGGALRLWTLVESMTEAARCWALRLCLRLKWKKVCPPGERISGKGSAAGRPEWAWDSRDHRKAMPDSRTAPGTTGLAVIRAHQSSEPLDLIRYCRGRK